MISTLLALLNITSFLCSHISYSYKTPNFSLNSLVGDSDTAVDNFIKLHSTVVLCYRDCYGLSPLKTVCKDFVHFHFQFKVDFTFNDIKVKNVRK